MLVVPASYVGVAVLHPLVSPENEFGNVIDVALGVAGTLAAGADKLTLPVAVLNPLSPFPPGSPSSPSSPGSPLAPSPWGRSGRRSENGTGNERVRNK